jgi:GNAT superfamily N-acetyltransferase
MQDMSSAHLSASAADGLGGPASVSDAPITFCVDGTVDDDELSRLHREAFRAGAEGFAPWSRRLQRHSICWVTALAGTRLVGFVNVIGDGGVHAILLDTVVDPRYQRCGIGRGLVSRAVEEARTLGCRWMHADYDRRAADFYERVCGFSSSQAGLIRLV